MLRDPQSYLWDVVNAAESIMRMMQDVTCEQYAATEIIHSAVERKFEIIGEALTQLPKADPDLAARVPDIGRIISFRNLLAHGYAFVQHRRVWQLIHDELPALRLAASNILAE